ncbi:MAG: hypothetical protein NDJ18_08660, partial [candidate division Zixibacteria bacterium]|nr:hypothetical protein [candidate division Zixibacteria bacterium]
MGSGSSGLTIARCKYDRSSPVSFASSLVGAIRWRWQDLTEQIHRSGPAGLTIARRKYDRSSPVSFASSLVGAIRWRWQDLTEQIHKTEIPSLAFSNGISEVRDERTS